MKPIAKITKSCSVGIWDNEQYVARIYADKITVQHPCVRWVDNTGSLCFKRHTIRDGATVAAIRGCFCVNHLS